MGNNDDEAVDRRPPSAERVARRALCLAAVVCRSAIEGDAGNGEAEALRQSVLEWAAAIGIIPEIEPRELALLQAPLGGLSERERIDGSWRGEGFAVLAWALGRCDLPPYDIEAEPYIIARAK